MRQKIIAGNWKMNKTSTEAQVLLSQLMENVIELPKEIQLIICPPSIYLLPFTKKSKKIQNISIGAQNCHHLNSGAFTGEVSAEMLKSIDVECCIVGHSERRQYYNEEDELIAAKVLACMEIGIKPIICVGESLEDRKAGKYLEVVEGQLKAVLNLLGELNEPFIIAYEPVWAIGTGETASPEQAQEIHKHLRSILNAAKDDLGDETSILYGGSCKPDNAQDILNCQDVDGCLIGSASLKADSFIQIAESF